MAILKPMATDDKKKVAVKFVVDKEKSRVVHAEADKDFVDVLFSFLTLPMGTILRILHKKLSVGCMDNLYESVEKLDIHHFQTEACKTMLLHPQSEAAALCYEDLEFNIGDAKPRDVYVCSKDGCCYYGKEPRLFSSVQNTPCPNCRETMGMKKTLPKIDVEPFVKKGVTYIISDDLHVQPASMIHTLSLLKKMDIQGRSVFEESHMDIGIDEILALLKRSLVSNMPLTDFYYNKDATDVSVSHNLDERKQIQVKTEASEDPESGGISIKLLVNKVDRRVLCAEAGGNFLNQVFIFLTLPLGSLIKFLDKNSDMGCVDNLYASVENLGSDYIQSEECRSILLSPKLAPFFGCSNSVLKLNESNPLEFSLNGYYIGHRYVEPTYFKELNPKSPQGERAMGGVYVKGHGKYVVTDDLCFSQFSTRLTLQILTEQGSSFGNIVEKEVRVAESELLKLLRAAVNSTTSLTDVFSLVRI